jgi:hypothetical protein
MEATSISLLALQGNLRGPEADRSLCWLVAADCQPAYSMAWKVLALQATLQARPDIATILETSRAKLSKLVEDPH